MWRDWVQQYGRYLHRRRLEVLRRFTLDRRYSFALDVGCGEGLLKKMGVPRTVGIDIQPGPNVTITASAESLPFRNATFELVFAGEVIEHLTDPAMALKDWVRVLKEGGRMVISTPNGLRVSLSGGHSEHKHLFAPRDMERSLRRLGMARVKSVGIFVAIVSGRRLFRRIPLDILKMFLLRAPVPMSISHNMFFKADKG